MATDKTTAVKDDNQTLRVLNLAEVLCGFVVLGISNKSLAALTQTTPVQVSKDIAYLIAKGWARKDDKTGHFHPTPEMAHVFGRVAADLARASQEVEELTRRFNRII